MSFLTDFASNLKETVQTVTSGGGKAPKPEKVKLLGRDRVVVTKGRSRFVTINGKLEPIAKARQLDKEYRSKKNKK